MELRSRGSQGGFQADGNMMILGVGCCLDGNVPLSGRMEFDFLQRNLATLQFGGQKRSKCCADMDIILQYTVYMIVMILLYILLHHMQNIILYMKRDALGERTGTE